MVDFRSILRSQFRAALAMLDECIRACPDAHWDSPIAKYPFWHVAYHAICFVDCYLSPSNDDFTRTVESRRSESFNPHPCGMAELEGEYPSRRLTRDELIQYLDLCRAKLDAIMDAETDATLAGPSGFSWLPFTRAEAHLYNLRHVQHHTGQLSASLRRADVQTRWARSG